MYTSYSFLKHDKKTIPLWKEEIKEYKDSAHFWHSVWKSADKPLNTELHKIMKKTRNSYHYQIRKMKKKPVDMLKQEKIGYHE